MPVMTPATGPTAAASRSCRRGEPDHRPSSARRRGSRRARAWRGAVGSAEQAAAKPGSDADAGQQRPEPAAPGATKQARRASARHWSPVPAPSPGPPPRPAASSGQQADADGRQAKPGHALDQAGQDEDRCRENGSGACMAPTVTSHGRRQCGPSQVSLRAARLTAGCAPHALRSDRSQAVHGHRRGRQHHAGAERSGLALAAASARVRGMETTLGASLLERGRRGVRPTPAGVSLARHARLVLAQMEILRGELREHARGGPRGLVRLLANSAARASICRSCWRRGSRPIRASISISMSAPATRSPAPSLRGAPMPASWLSPRKPRAWSFTPSVATVSPWWFPAHELAVGSRSLCRTSGSSFVGSPPTAPWPPACPQRVLHPRHLPALRACRYSSYMLIPTPPPSSSSPSHSSSTHHHSPRGA